MGAADTVTKAYMKENTVFADAFNYLLYRGRAVVDPAQLQELDTTEIALPFGAQDEDGKPQEDAVQKYRDVLKSAVIKFDGGLKLLQNQSKVIFRCFNGDNLGMNPLYFHGILTFYNVRKGVEIPFQLKACNGRNRQQTVRRNGIPLRLRKKVVLPDDSAHCFRNIHKSSPCQYPGTARSAGE